MRCLRPAGKGQKQSPETMKYSANKSLFLFAIIMGGTMSLVFIWAGLPEESISGFLALLANALGFGLVTSTMTFIMFWIFYKLIVGIGRYIHDRFYRTPTL